MKENKNEKIRYIISIYGIVQGVGFRPFIYNKAQEFGLFGYVSNNGASVLIDVEGAIEAAKGFIKKLLYTPPPLSQIEKVSIRKAAIRNYRGFKILKSDVKKEDLCFIPKDMTICNSCKQDILDNDSKWAKYAFTNCTDCGPRYSIIKNLPYDRCNTAMEDFEMCSSCMGEYENPENRRFHAQPVCCPDCGPRLQLFDCFGKELLGEEPLKAAARLIKSGEVLAVKGIGGFHLMCDGENNEAVTSLRNRKKRPHRPLSVMAADLYLVEQQCIMSDIERQLITSNRSPIILLKKKATCSLPDTIAPDTDKLGMMLPYAPIHVLLFAEGFKYLVATSGNISGMPIEYQNLEAINKLSSVADYFLLNNRDINIPIDDSVTKVFRNREVLSRVGRGYAPLSINIGSDRQIIALGGEQKSSICISQKGYAHLSQYLGDIKSPEAYENYKKVLNNFKQLFKLKPEAYVHDLHPYYLSTQYALEQSKQNLAIQHHFAHMAACMAEHKLEKPVIGVIYDGTGFGEDGRNWGGEILVGTLAGFTRAGHLKYCLIQGGDKAAEQPWRSAVSYLHGTGSDLVDVSDIDNLACITVKSALLADLNCYESSSMGRLFDCVSALLGLCSIATYDGQAAIMLETIADKHISDCYEYKIYEEKDCIIIDYEEIINGILYDIEIGTRASEVSSKFHNTIAAATSDAVVKIGRIHNIREAVLSGGCFENLLLLEKLVKRLEAQGFKVYHNEKLPCNDGGISFGQLAAAARILRG